jgi:2'-5' RNA ligase
MALHAIGLILPDKIETELDRLRNGYSKNMVYITIPHITLVQPFTPRVDVTMLTDKLRQVTEKTAPFTVGLNSIAYFEGKNNVAYIAVVNRQPLIDLHRDISLSIKGLLKGEQEGFTLDNFVPHVTIGQQIPDDLLPQIKQSLSKRIINYEITITSFALFANQDKEWTIVSNFALTG